MYARRCRCAPRTCSAPITSATTSMSRIDHAEAPMADIKISNIEALGKPLGEYSHLTRVKASEFVFIAGQVGVDRDGRIVDADDFDAQCVQTFANIEAALKSVGAGWANIVQFTTYLVHSQDIPKFMKF